MNRKLAATAVILLLLPAATAVLLTRLPAYLPAFLPASDLHACLPAGLTWLNEVLTPPAAVRHGRARPSSRTGLCGDCRMVLWVAGPLGQYSGKFVLSRNLEYKTMGVAMWLNVVLTTPSSSGTPRERQAKLRDGTVWGL